MSRVLTARSPMAMGAEITDAERKTADKVAAAEGKETVEGGGTLADYFERVLKYIPAEVVALYVALRALFDSQDASTGSMWVLAAIAWLLVPTYLFLAPRKEKDRPAALQVVFAVIAFPLWVFALGGEPVMSWGWYAAHAYWGAAALMVGTFVFGFIRPERTAESRHAARVAAKAAARGGHRGRG